MAGHDEMRQQNETGTSKKAHKDMQFFMESGLVWTRQIALGSYGLYYPEYAKLLSARWAGLTGTEDACDFLNERAGFHSAFREKV